MAFHDALSAASAGQFSLTVRVSVAIPAKVSAASIPLAYEYFCPLPARWPVCSVFDAEGQGFYYCFNYGNSLLVVRVVGTSTSFRIIGVGIVKCARCLVCFTLPVINREAGCVKSGDADCLFYTTPKFQNMSYGRLASVREPRSLSESPWGTTTSRLSQTAPLNAKSDGMSPLRQANTQALLVGLAIVRGAGAARCGQARQAAGGRRQAQQASVICYNYSPLLIPGLQP
jgi:hypothetical protein